MPDGKPSIDEDLEDDPFEGLELGDDAPEPTQEEMDEWATLDTPDEDVSAPFGAGSKIPAEPVAPSSTAPVQETQSTDKEKKDEITTTDVCTDEQPDRPKDTAPILASAATPAQPEPKPETLRRVTEPLLNEPITAEAPLSATPAKAEHSAKLSEITPAVSPSLLQLNVMEQSYAGNEDQDDDEETEGSQLLKDERWQQQQQRRSDGGSWGVGWGSGWGLGALGGKLREVAAGAVRDVKDLTETFQAALADVTGAEDEVEQARRISAMDRAVEAEAAGGAVIPHEGAQGPQGSALPTEAPQQAAEPAREVTPPLRGGGSNGRVSAGGALEPPSPPADPALEVGLQAIDAQVEQLATGAARAFSSLWGGLSSVAKVVAAEVAASVADVQSIEAVRGVAQIGTKLAHTAERGLETVGRTAMVLLEEVAGVGGAGHTGRRRIWGEEADARAADMGREPSSFQDFFYIYGGEQLAEEVNNLSNECSHLCNKSRSKLEGDQQQALDEALSSLGPYFNDPWVGSKATTAESGKDATGLDGVDKEAAERLGQMYDPIGYLCQDSLSRSEAFLHQITEAVLAARAAEASAAAAPLAKQRSKRMDGDDAECDEDEGGEDEEQAALLQRTRAEPRVLLDNFRIHFTKRLAEVTTAQLQLMLNLGTSLAAPARTGRPAVDGILWPGSSEQQAALLAAEARRMVADLHATTAAYAETLKALRSVPSTVVEGSSSEVAAEGNLNDEASPQPPVEAKLLDEMAAALAANSETAVATIKSGYKGLLYAVLLRSLVTQIAQQHTGPIEQQQSSQGEVENVAKTTVGRVVEVVQAPDAVKE